MMSVNTSHFICRKDRYIRQNMRHIIAISSKVGSPDVFLTIKCNLQWHKSKNELVTGQSVVDRPDPAARVFYIKLRAFMASIRNEKVFANVKV